MPTETLRRWLGARGFLERRDLRRWRAIPQRTLVGAPPPLVEATFATLRTTLAAYYGDENCRRPLERLERLLEESAGRTLALVHRHRRPALLRRLGGELGWASPRRRREVTLAPLELLAVLLALRPNPVDHRKAV